MATATSAKPKAAKTAALKKDDGSAKSSTAVAVRKQTNIVSIQEALKAQTAGITGRINPATGNKIRATQDKKFILPDGTKTVGPLELVIVDFVTVHEFYENGYDKDNIVPPGCFAVGVNPKQMFPSDNVPNRQADNCQDCLMNQWGSDGAGKACKNGRLLAVLPADADEDTPLWLLQPSPTAIKAFDAFVAGVVHKFQMPPIGVVCTVGFDDSVDYARMQFTDPVPNPRVNEMFARQEEARELLNAPRDVSGWKPMSKPAPGKKFAGRR